MTSENDQERVRVRLPDVLDDHDGRLYLRRRYRIMHECVQH
jgi:hypothetical protein